jgi:hypothetical protein
MLRGAHNSRSGGLRDGTKMSFRFSNAPQTLIFSSLAKFGLGESAELAILAFQDYRGREICRQTSCTRQVFGSLGSGKTNISLIRLENNGKALDQNTRQGGRDMPCYKSETVLI